MICERLPVIKCFKLDEQSLSHLLLIITVSWPCNEGPVSISRPSVIQGIKSAIWNCRRSQLTTAVVNPQSLSFFSQGVHWWAHFFPCKAAKKTCSMLLEVLQKHCVISDQHKTCCNEKTPSPERENFLTMVLIPRREKHPFSGWQHGRDFNSGPNSLRHLKKLYSVYGCGRKKSPHLSNWSSAAQSNRTSTTNNCVSKYKHKNTVLWHVMCAWILPLIVLPHSWCKANVPQAPLGLSVLVIPVVQSVQERDGAELLSVILHFRALTGPENMA